MLASLGIEQGKPYKLTVPRPVPGAATQRFRLRVGLVLAGGQALAQQVFVYPQKGQNQRAFAACMDGRGYSVK